MAGCEPYSRVRLDEWLAAVAINHREAMAMDCWDGPPIRLDMSEIWVLACFPAQWPTLKWQWLDLN
jgi:hypothetical protein